MKTKIEQVIPIPRRIDFDNDKGFNDAMTKYRYWVFDNATPIEKPLYHTARHMGIDLEFQKEVKYYTESGGTMAIHTDFYYEDITGEIRVIIECDSKKWHEENNRVNSTDKIRTRALRDRGYEVFRFTTNDIWSDAKGCIEKVKDYISFKREEIIERNLYLLKDFKRK